MEDITSVNPAVLDHCLIHLPIASRVLSQASRISDLTDSLPNPVTLPALQTACSPFKIPEAEVRALWEIFCIFADSSREPAALGLFLTLQNFRIANKSRPILETRASPPPRGIRAPERPSPVHAAAFLRRRCPARLPLLGLGGGFQEVSGVHRGGVFLEEATEPRLVISRVSESVIYVSVKFSQILVWGCFDSEFVFLDAGKILTVSHCEKISVKAACDFLHAETVIDSSMFILSKRPPVISGDSRGCILGPLNVLCPEIPTRFTLADSANFSKPICAALVEDPFSFVPPEKFLVSNFPGGKTLPPMPEVYARALAARRRKLAGMREELHAIADEGAKRQVMTILQGHFREWLTGGGGSKHRQLVELSRLI